MSALLLRTFFYEFKSESDINWRLRKIVNLYVHKWYNWLWKDCLVTFSMWWRVHSKRYSSVFSRAYIFSIFPGGSCWITVLWVVKCVLCLLLLGQVKNSEILETLEITKNLWSDLFQPPANIRKITKTEYFEDLYELIKNQKFSESSDFSVWTLYWKTKTQKSRKFDKNSKIVFKNS